MSYSFEASVTIECPVTGQTFFAGFVCEDYPFQTLSPVEIYAELSEEGWVFSEEHDAWVSPEAAGEPDEWDDFFEDFPDEVPA